MKRRSLCVWAGTCSKLQLGLALTEWCQGCEHPTRNLTRSVLVGRDISPQASVLSFDRGGPSVCRCAEEELRRGEVPINGRDRNAEHAATTVPNGSIQPTRAEHPSSRIAKHIVIGFLRHEAILPAANEYVRG